MLLIFRVFGDLCSPCVAPDCVEGLPLNHVRSGCNVGQQALPGAPCLDAGVSVHFPDPRPWRDRVDLLAPSFMYSPGCIVEELIDHKGACD